MKRVAGERSRRMRMSRARWRASSCDARSTEPSGGMGGGGVDGGIAASLNGRERRHKSTSRLRPHRGQVSRRKLMQNRNGRLRSRLKLPPGLRLRFYQQRAREILRSAQDDGAHREMRDACGKETHEWWGRPLVVELLLGGSRGREKRAQAGPSP